MTFYNSCRKVIHGGSQEDCFLNEEFELERLQMGKNEACLRAGLSSQRGNFLAEYNGLSQTIGVLLRHEGFYMGQVPQTVATINSPPPQPPSVRGLSHLSCSPGQRDSCCFLSCGSRSQPASPPEHVVPWMFISLCGVLEKFCVVPDPFFAPCFGPTCLSSLFTPDRFLPSLCTEHKDYQTDPKEPPLARRRHTRWPVDLSPFLRPLGPSELLVLLGRIL